MYLWKLGIGVDLGVIVLIGFEVCFWNEGSVYFWIFGMFN